jgi:hypothetical protein
MVCIGIPVCRPLYKCWLDKFFSTFHSTRSTSGYRKQQQQGKSGGSGQRYALRTFGGATIPGPSQRRADTNDGEPSSDGESETGTRVGVHKDGYSGTDKDSQKQSAFDELALGVNGPFNEAIAVGGASWKNGSEEEILGSEFRAEGDESSSKQSQDDLESGKGHGPRKGSIQVTEEWRVDRSRP